MWYLLPMKIVLLSLLLIAALPYPTLDQGRCRPANTPLDEQQLCLISAERGEWLPLNALDSATNPTGYPDSLFEQMRALYLAGNFDRLEELLWEGYEPYIGTPYLQAHDKQRLYPSKLQLRAEMVLGKIPFTLLLIGGYLLTLLFRPLYPVIFSFHSLLLLARVYIASRPPVSNMAETLIYVPWVVALAAWTTRVRPWGAVGAAGLLLLFWVSRLGEGLESLQPVLDSNFWLSTHVLMVVGSYGVLLLSAILAHLYLVRPATRLPSLILQVLYIGTALLLIGTLLGGVWASQSWGRFWDWDPKETWAFISICLYLALIHARLFGLLGDFAFALTAAAAFFSVTFTWYGVNYILGTGLHSYGFGEGGQWIYWAGLGGDALLLSLLALRHKLKRVSTEV